ncbi:MAG: hypothetical protein K2P81_16820 [Bacteriovoracaceae bacterium]|nr:hypothetical protein [Bacteriovoracaceae bacterium]
MKKLITAALILTSFVSYSQDSTPVLSNEEEASILESAPVEETPVATEAPPIEELVSPIVSEQPVEEEKVKEETKEEDYRVKAPMAAFGVRGLAPETVSLANQEEDEGSFNHRKSHWVGIFGFESTRYKMPLNFNGASKSYNDKASSQLWGGRLGLGRELYLGAGFVFNVRAEGYYMGTLFNSIKTADPEYPGTDVSSEKDIGQYFGGDAVAHFGWMFDYKTKNPFLGEMTYMAMEIFVEAGVGRGKTYLRKKYDFEADKIDHYNFILEDSYTSQNVSAGLNFLSTSSGAFLYLKATQTRLTVDKREIRGSSQESSGAVNSLKRTIKNPDIDPITIFALGGGYKF